jgi:predicted  nucleic acid-binding Zn-ribbon protein
MGSPSMESYLTGRDPAAAPPKPPKNRNVVLDGVKSALLVVLAVAVGYLIYDSFQMKAKNQADLAKINEQLKNLEGRHQAGEAKLSSLRGEITQTQQAVGSTKAELKRTAQQIQSEGERTKAELSQALATKADSSQVAAIKTEADTKIGQVSQEVGGVKSEVGVVKTDLAGTKRDLEGTQRQLLDVRENLTAAVAKNASELALLRRKGERDYFEFEIPKKNQYVKVEDIRLVLTKTDAKKGKYNLQILVDDSKLEKKDRTVNEPVQFLVGKNRVRYEIVVNWVQKDRVGGYLAIPKDKTLSSERAATN